MSNSYTAAQRIRNARSIGGLGDVFNSQCDFFRRCAVGQNPTAQYPVYASSASTPAAECKCEQSDFWLWVALGLAAYLVMKGK